MSDTCFPRYNLSELIKIQQFCTVEVNIERFGSLHFHNTYCMALAQAHPRWREYCIEILTLDQCTQRSENFFILLRLHPVRHKKERSLLNFYFKNSVLSSGIPFEALKLFLKKYFEDYIASRRKKMRRRLLQKGRTLIISSS